MGDNYGRAPVDWSYDTVMDAPNYLSFESGTGPHVNQYRGGGGGQFNRGHKAPWVPRGRGGPPRPPWQQPHEPFHPYRGSHGPPPPRGGYYGRPPRPYHHGPPPPGPFYPNRGGMRGGRGGGGFGDRGRGGRFNNQRSRGGRGRGHGPPPADLPISAYFHPSMLEDPWAPPQSQNKQRPVVEEVKVADDDPELREIVAQMKEESKGEVNVKQESTGTEAVSGGADEQNGQESANEGSQNEGTEPETSVHVSE